GMMDDPAVAAVDGYGDDLHAADASTRSSADRGARPHQPITEGGVQRIALACSEPARHDMVVDSVQPWIIGSDTGEEPVDRRGGPVVLGERAEPQILDAPRT